MSAMLCIIVHQYANSSFTPAEHLQVFELHSVTVISLKSLHGYTDCFFRFMTALGGLSPGDIIKRTTDRLETIHSEGVHVCPCYMMFLLVKNYKSCL